MNTENSPTYRELFPVKPFSMDIMKASEGGVIGTLPGIIGAIQANETIKYIVGTGDTLDGKLLLLNALSMRFKTINLSCGSARKDKNNYKNYFYSQNQIEEINITTTTKEIRLKNLSDFLSKNNVLLIDVREPFEFDLNAIKNSVNIPLYSISNKIKEISVSSKNKKIILYCNTGDRSRQAANILKARNINSFIVIPD